MSNQINHIGLKTTDASELALKLNDLIANYQVFYMNVRGFHWNVRGEKFFELHLKFEELYNDLVLKIDELAERVLTLGHVPAHHFQTYLETSQIKPAQNISEGKSCVQSIVDAFGILILKQRALLTLSGEANDEGTNALMSDYIREQEKLVWMYAAWLG